MGNGDTRAVLWLHIFDVCILHSRTGLKSVIAHAIVIWLKFKGRNTFFDRLDAYKAIHDLDSLTPAPGFVFPLSLLAASSSRRKRKIEDRPVYVAEVILSDNDGDDDNDDDDKTEDWILGI